MSEEFSISFHRINHVTVAVPAGEEEKVRAFYGGVLGLRELPRNKALQGHYTLIWYELLDIQLHLDFSPPWVTPPENRHMALEVHDLHKIRQSRIHFDVRMRSPLAMVAQGPQAAFQYPARRFHRKDRPDNQYFIFHWTR